MCPIVQDVLQAKNKNKLHIVNHFLIVTHYTAFANYHVVINVYMYTCTIFYFYMYISLAVV